MPKQAPCLHLTTSSCLNKEAACLHLPPCRQQRLREAGEAEVKAKSIQEAADLAAQRAEAKLAEAQTKAETAVGLAEQVCRDSNPTNSWG